MLAPTNPTINAGINSAKEFPVLLISLPNEFMSFRTFGIDTINIDANA
jgi:hypothetical protein